MFKTQNEPSVEEESRTILTDEMKEFIVGGLARYDTPSQVAEPCNRPSASRSAGSGCTAMIPPVPSRRRNAGGISTP